MTKFLAPEITHFDNKGRVLEFETIIADAPY
jgi:hypothetical protein